jgi:Domain of unknown function (DUF4105)
MDLFLEVILGALLLAAAALVAWTAGAIYFDVCSAAKWGRWVALGWVVSVIAMFAVWQPLWQPLVALAGAEALFLVWWFRQQPSNNRDWDPVVAVLSRAVHAEDAVTIENVRNFEYRSLHDFTPNYETRTVRLPNLVAVDIIFFKWFAGWMSHPVMVFDFGVDGRLCISIEVRFLKGQGYSLLRSLYRQQELIFLVADERDVILRRTKHSKGQDALLYRLNSDPDELRAVFLDYVSSINSLYESPRWYHGFCTNCTTSFYKLPSRRGRARRDWRVVLNGLLDQALYEDGRLDRTLPFPELRRRASLNDIAINAPDEGFGDYIRQQLDRRLNER